MKNHKQSDKMSTTFFVCWFGRLACIFLAFFVFVFALIFSSSYIFPLPFLIPWTKSGNVRCCIAIRRLDEIICSLVATDKVRVHIRARTYTHIQQNFLPFCRCQLILSSTSTMLLCLPDDSLSMLTLLC